jgi:hypothetical protein
MYGDSITQAALQSCVCVLNARLLQGKDSTTSTAADLLRLANSIQAICAGEPHAAVPLFVLDMQETRLEYLDTMGRAYRSAPFA